MSPKEDNPLDRLGPQRESTRSKREGGFETALSVPHATDAPPMVDDDEEPKVMYEPSFVEKCINILLCRGDLASQQLDVRPVSLVGLFRYATPGDWFMFSIGVLCAIVSGFSQPVLSLISGRITNILMIVPVTSKKFRDSAYENVYIFLGIGVFLTITNYIQYMCFQGVCTRVIARNRSQFVRAVLRQNAGWFDKHHAGALATALNDDMERIREGIGDKLGLLIRGCAMFIAAVIIAFIYEWRLAFIMLGVAPTCCIVMSIMARKMTSTTISEMMGVGRAGAIAEESIMGVRTVQAFNGQPEMVERYENELKKGKSFAVWKGIWSGVYGGMFFFFLFAFQAAGMLFGGHLLRIGVMSDPGDVFIVVMSMLLGAYFLGLISPHLMVLLNARVAAAHIYKIIDRVPKIDPYSSLGRRPDNIRGKVEFKDVHFRYPSRKDVKVLNGLNLTINPGETVALVGHSGCGKSTSVGLLTRLYECESGKVTIDGNDVRELNIDWLRTVVGIVQQEPILFNATIAENLRIGNPDVTNEKMIHCCKMANAHDFIMKTPKGYDTLIGDGGVQLSGGQKQRVAIARTLVRDPKILLLDEATSALDAESESIVQSALDNAAKGRSTIVIAHRLSTIRNADKIVYFEKGQIAEMGNHDELVRMGGKYYELVKAQQFQPEDDESISLEEEVDEPSELSRTSTLRSSHRSGREAFQRGVSLNDSFSNRAGVARSSAEDEAFAEEVKRVMEEDGQINAGFLDIFKNAKGNYTFMALGLICAIARGMELPALAMIFGYVFEAFSWGEFGPAMMHRLCMALIIYCSVGIGTWIFQILSSYFFAEVSENVTMTYRVQTFRNILYQDASYFDNPQHAPGKLITRLAADAPNVKAVIDGRMLQVIYGLTSILCCIAIGFGFCWPVAILGTGMNIMLAVAMVGLALLIQKMNIDLIKNDEAGRLSIEILENVKTIQLLTRCPYFNQRYEEASERQKKNELKKGWIEAANFTISQSFLYFMMTVTYALGIYLMHKEKKSQDKTFRCIIAMLLGSVSVMNSASYFPEFVKARTAAGLLFSMIHRKSKTGDANQGERMTLRGNVMFENINFSYPQRPHQPVMKGLHFTITRGQTVALVGPSGSGKSTCISMLERFYDPTGGALRLDGKDLKLMSLNHVRTQMALVGQEPRLFSGTIKDNILFGLDKSSITEQKILDTLKTANALNFVKAMPQGLDTEVGEKGGQLSGGQKQRIAIARALIRDPKVLLLDEATSALDSESERAVQEALDAARQGRTCVTIAHRLSSIQNSDVIVYIANGCVQEQGSHSELMRMKGKYYDLIKKQDLAA